MKICFPTSSFLLFSLFARSTCWESGKFDWYNLTNFTLACNEESLNENILWCSLEDIASLSQNVSFGAIWLDWLSQNWNCNVLCRLLIFWIYIIFLSDISFRTSYRHISFLDISIHHLLIQSFFSSSCAMCDIKNFCLFDTPMPASFMMKSFQCKIIIVFRKVICLKPLYVFVLFDISINITITKILT